jgi:oligopeptidase A
METQSVRPENPLLNYGDLPAFDRISADDVVPAMRWLLAALEEELAILEDSVEPTWAGLVGPIERLSDRLGFSWGIVGHLMGVRNSDALREAHQSVQGEVVEFSLRLAQSAAIYRGLQDIRSGAAWGTLDATQRRIVETLLRDAEHAGVGLDEKKRKRFNAIALELAEAATRFSNNVLDATKAFSMTIEDADAIAGTPNNFRELAAQSARDAGLEKACAESGPWRITLDAPSFIPFMQHCQVRDLREQLYRAYITRASTGEHTNVGLIETILSLRHEEASLLGFGDYAEMSLSTKMAGAVPAVDALLEELRVASQDAAVRDLGQLREFARAQGQGEELCLWDVAFWSERLRESRFSYSEEELRPYFPLPRVLEGLFALSHRLFGIQIESADGEVPVWDEGVRFFRVRDEQGVDLAAFYLDPYSRPAEKRGGAWMDECVGRSGHAGMDGDRVRKPVAYLICNQAPPVAGQPSLMSFDEVTTLFHEFGHGLQHMLTRVDEPLASGIRNIEWDAVELPSQFMENWLYDRDTLGGVSGHVESGKTLPGRLFDKLQAARTYRAGSDMLRQLYFSLIDLELHARYVPGGEPDAFMVQRSVAERTTVLRPLAEDRFLCSFSHIFAGGYAAGYYSYKWAEVLSADAFAAFEEVGLDNTAAIAETGRRFRDTVLALGGSRPPKQVFESFRGRDPSTTALLRHSGLL